MNLLLSLFPGIDLLGMAFEEEGFCVVRGPDVLWGGDIHQFHPPRERFDGVIGGPPCQKHSPFAYLVKATGKQTKPDLIPEYARVVEESAVPWFLMENSWLAPQPKCPNYAITELTFNNRHVGGVSNRVRKFYFGVRGHAPVSLLTYIETTALEPFEWLPAALACGGVKPGTEHRRGRRPGREYGYCTHQTFKTHLRSQGLPPDFLADAPFTVKGKHQVVGNGVPLPMGKAIAKAVRKALEELT